MPPLPTSKYEVDGTKYAKARPKVIEFQRLLEVEQCKGHEDGKSDDFLNDLELGHAEYAVSDSVRRDLEEILEQRDTPADQSRDHPRFVAKLLEMGIPRKGHEDIAHREQEDCRENRTHGRDA